MIERLLSNRYKLIEVCGKGGMAVVYKAKDTLLNRIVAVKILKDEFNQNEQFIKKFNKESQAAASLSHNNIVKVFDVGIDNNDHYIVMEYIEGKTLKDYIKTKGKLDYKEAILIGKQIAYALGHAHKNNIIHRDIKPHNILINEEMIPKVTDFGIARAITSSTITLVEETMGSVHYISPEQARGGFVNEKSDLYSLGVVMYEMLMGEVPFDNENSISIAIKHIQEEIKFPEEAYENIPQNLIEVILKLVNKNPSNRYSNAKELIKDLILIQNNPKAIIKTEETIVDSPTQVIPVINNNQIKSKKKNNTSEKKKKLTLSTILIIVLLSIIIGASIFYISDYLMVKEVEIPKLEGLPLKDAIELIDKNQLNYDYEFKNDPKIQRNHVVSQNPKEGASLKEGQTVTLIISDGPQKVEIPNVIGKDEIEGIQYLENLGFNVTVELREFNEDYEEGRIYNQYPRPGETKNEGSEISLSVSKGKDTTIVPNLIGKNINDAKNIILSEGLRIGEITEIPSPNYEKGIVIKQDPKRNKEVTKETVINLTISKGKIKEKTININLNDYTDFEEPQDVLVKVTLFDQDHDSTVVHNEQHKSNENISVTFKGVGVQYYQIEIDGKKYDTKIITF